MPTKNWACKRGEVVQPDVLTDGLPFGSTVGYSIVIIQDFTLK